MAVALITGASKGIGRGIAIELARGGWDVFINFNSDETGAEATANSVREIGQQAWIVGGDVGYSDQVDDMFRFVAENTGRLDLLVNNAAVQTWSPLAELDEESFDRTIRTNLKGTFLCTKAAIPLLKESDNASIINIGSGANKRPFPNLVDYVSSKGAIENFTQVAAVELGPLGIRVNCIGPGAIEIERTKQEAGDYSGTWSPLTPMRRIGEPKDVAKAAAFLASRSAEFITGQTLYVDGGLFTQGPWPYEK